MTSASFYCILWPYLDIHDNSIWWTIKNQSMKNQFSLWKYLKNQNIFLESYNRNCKKQNKSIFYKTFHKNSFKTHKKVYHLKIRKNITQYLIIKHNETPQTHAIIFTIKPKFIGTEYNKHTWTEQVYHIILWFIDIIHQIIIPITIFLVEYNTAVE